MTNENNNDSSRDIDRGSRITSKIDQNVGLLMPFWANSTHRRGGL